MDELVGKVEAWAIDKGLQTADPSKQLLKLYEEVAEVSQAVTRNQYDELKLEMGDVLVVLTVLSLQTHIDLADAYQSAYDKISKRKGIMRDGVFIKEEDL